MRRWGIFGGSFNPIHQGHVAPVLDVRDQLELERVLYLPTASPPHKSDTTLAPAAQRYAMVELALLDRSGLVVSDLEMDPAHAPHYSINTAERLAQRWPDVEFTWILGADSLLAFHTWHRWRELAQHIRIAAMARPGWNLENDGWKGGEDLPGELLDWIQSDRVHIVENEPLALASTDIRDRLAQVQDASARVDLLDRWVRSGTLHPRVGRYLEKYPLYAPTAPTS